MSFQKSAHPYVYVPLSKMTMTVLKFEILSGPNMPVFSPCHRVKVSFHDIFYVGPNFFFEKAPSYRFKGPS
jgi:hypothetical protein